MDHKRVVDELTQGKEFAKQLQIHLTNPSSSHETQEILIHNILSSYEKSLSLLNIRGLTANESNGESHLHRGMLESQISFSKSPRSEVSDHGFKDPDYKDLGATRKLNGGVDKWKSQAKVSGEMGFEDQALDDGYCWIKYGQKDILGAKHPRGYYRCSYRQLEGCLATKYVQRSDEDPNIFNLTYKGSHTCNPGIHTSSTLPPPPCPSPPQELQNPQQQNQLLQSPEFLQTKNLDTPSFQILPTSDNNFVFPTHDNTFYGSKTSRSNHFTMRQPQVHMFEESKLKKIVSAAPSTTSSHNVDMAFPFGELGFGENFNFENLIFFD